jgi:hypothetical protein
LQWIKKKTDVNMKKSLITLLLLCTAALVQAATLKGIVKDSSTGEPLTGATVYVKGTTSGAATDLDGRFEITGIKGKECTWMNGWTK